jgi:hypothetical protein
MRIVAYSELIRGLIWVAQDCFCSTNRNRLRIRVRMKRITPQSDVPRLSEREKLTEEEAIRRIKGVERWREKKLKEMTRTGRVPRSTDSILPHE